MDIYDKAVAYLKEHPDKIPDAWLTPHEEAGGILFHPVEKSRGCLTTIKSGCQEAGTDELTEAIRADPRIPKLSEGIHIGNLAVFAEWQRRLDRELHREIPTSIGG